MVPRPLIKFPIAAVPFPSPVPVFELGVAAFVAAALVEIVFVGVFSVDLDAVFVSVLVTFSTFGAEALLLLPVKIFSFTGFAGSTTGSGFDSFTSS